MSLPKVRKTLKSRLSNSERLKTGVRDMAVVALVSAGLVAAVPATASANLNPQQVTESPTINPIAGSMVLFPASTNSGPVNLATHYSHASHSSHASHASHYSHYSSS
jgi:hypothetical protein